MSKRTAMFEIDGDFDFEEMMNGAHELMQREEKGGSVYLEGGRPEGSYNTPGAQIVIKFNSRHEGCAPATMLISHKGKVQLFYETLDDFYHCTFHFLKPLLGYKEFTKLKVNDVDSFDFYMSNLRRKYMIAFQNSVAEEVNLGKDEQTLKNFRQVRRNKIRSALIDALNLLLEKMEGGMEGWVYDFTYPWMTSLWKAFSDVMLLLWIDKDLGKDVVREVGDHLQRLRQRAVNFVETGAEVKSVDQCAP